MIKLKDILVESSSIVLSPEFGGNDDMKFLKITWHLDNDDLIKLLEKVKSDIIFLKKSSNGGSVLNLFAKRDLQIIVSRKKYIEQIIKYKKSDKNYIPDQFK